MGHLADDRVEIWRAGDNGPYPYRFRKRWEADLMAGPDGLMVDGRAVRGAYDPADDTRMMEVADLDAIHGQEALRDAHIGIRGPSCTFSGGSPQDRSYSLGVEETWPAVPVFFDHERVKTGLLTRDLSSTEQLATDPEALGALAAHFAEETAAGAFPVSPRRKISHAGDRPSS